MKYILTLATLVLATSCFGQEACPAPIDVNSHGAVDIEDFLNVLGLFGDTDYDADGIWDSVDDCVGAESSDSSKQCQHFSSCQQLNDGVKLRTVANQLEI